MKKIRQIATNVRRWAEKYAQDSINFPSDLEGMCAICSVKIFNKLKENGYSPVLCLSYHSSDPETGAHVYIVVGGMLVDVTATQFSVSHGKVIVREKRKQEEQWYWQTSCKFQSSEALIERQEKDGWAMYQIKTAELN